MSVLPKIPAEFLSFEVLVWVISCVLISVGLGVIIGNGIAVRSMTWHLRKDREKLIKALQTLLSSTEKLSTDVGTHSSELVSVEQSVSDLATDGDLESVQDALLNQIGAVLQANKRMEDDLVVTRYKLEEQAQQLDKTRKEARTDELSGLANRKSFDEAFQFALSQYKRNKVPFALVLADVDHFKRINDVHGHQSGDRVVTRIGKVLNELCRDRDHISRYGGDEFGIILMGASDENARRAAARIRAAIERANFDVGSEGGRIAVTFSMGMAFPREDDSTESMFERADQALYQSKKAGRNQLHVCSSQDSDSTSEPSMHAHPVA
jgi:diguanylate cyclase